jgi:5'(3')-deoxyribonucleotidase
MKPRIGCDLDSTIAAFYEGAIKAAHECQQEVSLENWTSWDIAECFGKDADKIISDAMKTPEFWHDLHPLPGCTKELIRLMQEYEIHIITVRPPQFIQLTHDWLCENEIPFDGLIVVSNREEKLAVAKALQCVAFLDDNQNTVEEMRDAGMVAGQLEWPWNKGGPGIIRAHTWAGLVTGLEYYLSESLKQSQG